MLVSCKYCGKVHKLGEVCKHKPKRKTKEKLYDKFRNTYAWRQKREAIKKRDFFMCRLCVCDQLKSGKEKISFY